MTTIYTNAMLTVIAFCLAVIAFRGQPVTPAHAQEQTHVVIDQVDPSAFLWGLHYPVPVRILP
jgi:hypothetical protein